LRGEKPVKNQGKHRKVWTYPVSMWILIQLFLHFYCAFPWF
jgi:hypothetical protein